MNYKVITDTAAFETFVNWLPELEGHEAYYLTLLGRKKYHDSAKSDKTALKRFVATSKDLLIRKVRQLEIPQDLYLNKSGEPIHQDALALYISVNPRSLVTAQQNLLRRLVDVVIDTNNVMNPAALALSEIQKAKSRTVYVDFDFDIDEDKVPPIIDQIIDLVGRDAVRFLKTRGGLHALVEPRAASEAGPKTWHKQIAALDGCDIAGNSLIPVPGSIQGGFTPYFMA